MRKSSIVCHVLPCGRDSKNSSGSRVTTPAVDLFVRDHCSPEEQPRQIVLLTEPNVVTGSRGRTEYIRVFKKDGTAACFQKKSTDRVEAGLILRGARDVHEDRVMQRLGAINVGRSVSATGLFGNLLVQVLCIHNVWRTAAANTTGALSDDYEFIKEQLSSKRLDVFVFGGDHNSKSSHDLKELTQKFRLELSDFYKCEYTFHGKIFAMVIHRASAELEVIYSQYPECLGMEHTPVSVVLRSPVALLPACDSTPADEASITPPLLVSKEPAERPEAPAPAPCEYTESDSADKLFYTNATKFLRPPTQRYTWKKDAAGPSPLVRARLAAKARDGPTPDDLEGAAEPRKCYQKNAKGVLHWIPGCNGAYTVSPPPHTRRVCKTCKKNAGSASSHAAKRPPGARRQSAVRRSPAASD